MQRKKLKRLLPVLFLIVLPVLALWQRQAIWDVSRLYGYEAPSEIEKLATDTNMTSETRRLFYVYRPSLEDKTAFKNNCQTGEQTIVIGCYIDGKGIYLLNVTDSRLNGIEQVTSAHEMLHAAYMRLSSRERRKVDAMTAKAFEAVTDQRIKDTIELYRKQDSTVVSNELHSILGTEVRQLPADLEQYYRRYFTDRSKVVSFSEQYEQAFSDRKKQIANFDSQLATLKTQIEDLRSSLSRQSSSLASERSRMTLLRSSGQISAYNAAVPGFNSAVDNYNQGVDELGKLIDQFNDIVAKRNAVASEETDLVNAIDSRSSVPARQ